MEKVTLSNSTAFSINTHTKIINDTNTLINSFIARPCISIVTFNRGAQRYLSTTRGNEMDEFHFD